MVCMGKISLGRVFPAGMSAIFAITTLVKTGEEILTDVDIYGGKGSDFWTKNCDFCF